MDDRRRIIMDSEFTWREEARARATKEAYEAGLQGAEREAFIAELKISGMENIS